MKNVHAIIAFAIIICSCKSTPPKEEQIRFESADAPDTRDTTNSVNSNAGYKMSTYPQRVILNGMPQHRLITIYKYLPPKKEARNTFSSSNSYDRGEYWDDDHDQHFMPGIDLLFGYNLLNLAHYDMKSEQLNYLFQRPVLIKSVYYPSYEQDSVGDKPNRKPIIRDYFLVSAYDEDTNGDTLLNRHDLRRFYHFNASCDVKTQLIPPDYSVLRSQYDFDNDVMYIFARHDDNKNGKSEPNEETHVFWISLKAPAAAKRMY
ncbi:MAG: hypothetical protein WDO14_09445 [Bacteroidota bacterium]